METLISLGQDQEKLNSHPLLTDLVRRENKADQVAQILAAGMRGWLSNSHKWVSKTESTYDRTGKAKDVTFSVFSNGGEFVGLPVREKPFFQVEVDRFTKMVPACKELPWGFGVCESIFDRQALRDMAYPYLYMITILIRQRGYTPIGIYFDEGEDRPLQLDLLGGRCIWRVMLWQNRLINEYNDIIKIDPSFATNPDGRFAKIKAITEKYAENQSLTIDLDAEEPVPLE